jgi:hypothetical protein
MPYPCGPLKQNRLRVVLRTFRVMVLQNNLLCRSLEYPSGAAKYTKGLVWDPGGAGSKL